jgi:hypothetical protein
VGIEYALILKFCASALAAIRKYMLCLGWLEEFLFVAFMTRLTASRLSGSLFLVLGSIPFIPIKRRIR